MVDKPTGFGGLTYHPMMETLMLGIRRDSNSG